MACVLIANTRASARLGVTARVRVRERRQAQAQAQRQAKAKCWIEPIFLINLYS